MPNPDQQIVATIIGNTSQRVSSELLAKISGVLTQAGAVNVSCVKLSEGKAYDILFDGIEPTQAEAIIREIFGDTKLDVIVQPTMNRRKKMLVSDMDATFVIGETTAMIAAQAGAAIGAEIARLTTAAKSDPTIDYATSLRERFAPLKGITVTQLQNVFNQLIISPGGFDLMRTMQRNGCFTALVSGGTDWLVEKIAKKAGVDFWRANHMIIENGALTGEIAGEILDSAGKKTILLELCKKQGIKPTEVIAVGDGANDLGMLTCEGVFGIAYHAKEPVRSASAARIDYAGLEALLYCQGYKEHEIVKPPDTLSREHASWIKELESRYKQDQPYAAAFRF